ncbi:hypothetical protein A4X06_0g2586 [Tilletia controversa]|uniref:Aquaporin n=1 Tax=Tilletia controversa TaxID=13291 RepID=A0A8X7MVL2_9BASI|nr:hypothetical protein A4X06_0g2586 [Tilletia controversa]
MASGEELVRAADVAEPVNIDVAATASASATTTATATDQSAPESRGVPDISLDNDDDDAFSDQTATQPEDQNPAHPIGTSSQLPNNTQPASLVELQPLPGGANQALPTEQLGTRTDGAHVDVVKDSKGRFFRRIIHSASSSSSATRKRTRAAHPKQHHAAGAGSGGGVTYGLGHSRGAPVVVRMGQEGYTYPQHQPPQYVSTTSEPVSRANSRTQGGYSGGAALGTQSTNGTECSAPPTRIAQRTQPLTNPNSRRGSLDPNAQTDAARIAASMGFGPLSSPVVGGSGGPTISVNAELLTALREIIRDEVQTAQMDTVLAFKKGLPPQDEDAGPRSEGGALLPTRQSDGTIVPALTHNAEKKSTEEKTHHPPDSVLAERGPDATSPTSKESFTHNEADQKKDSSSSMSISSAHPSCESASATDELSFPNPWARFRYSMREPFAEFLGTCILIIFGNGINMQVFVSRLYDPSSPKGDYLSVSFGWGIGTAMAIFVGGGVSGAHLNPAVTLSLAIFRGFPWKKVPQYVIAQIAGGMVGALLIYGLYVNPIRVVDPGKTETTAALFTTFPAEFLRSPSTRLTAFYNEVLATAVLLIIILAIGDAANTPPPDGMAPLTLLWAIVGIGATLGWQTAYCLNIARDLGPRIALAILGYPADLIWSFNAYYFLWTPILATLVGAVLGGFIYDALIYTGGESPLNKRWRWSDVRWSRHSKKKMPAGISA